LTFILVIRRPKAGVRPPAAGLDPQLGAGGAEADVAAGGPGQDLPAKLRRTGSDRQEVTVRKWPTGSGQH